MDLTQYYEDFLLALCLWREARGESFEAKLAVRHVIMNRAADPRWPDDYAGVILQPKQFSSFSAGDPNAVKFPALGDPSWIQCCHVAMVASIEDPTKGATFYHSGPREKLPERCQRDFPPEKLTAKIGAFSFYRV